MYYIQIKVKNFEQKLELKQKKYFFTIIILHLKINAYINTYIYMYISSTICVKIRIV